MPAKKPTKTISVEISFEEIKLPPFQEILIVGKQSPQGKLGILKSFELLSPNGFTLIEIEDENIEAIFVNKHILKKITEAEVVALLSERVFPFVSSDELVRVDMKLKVHYSGIEIDYGSA